MDAACDYPARDSIVDLDFHPEQSRAVRLALRIGLERNRAAAIQAVVQQKVQRAQVSNLEPLDLAQAYPSKMSLHTLGSHLLDQYRVVFRLQSYKPHVGSVALITRSGMSYLKKLYLCHLNHASLTEISGATSLFGIRAGQ